MPGLPVRRWAWRYRAWLGRQVEVGVLVPDAATGSTEAPFGRGLSVLH